jgi:hypothetical protein
MAILNMRRPPGFIAGTGSFEKKTKTKTKKLIWREYHFPSKATTTTVRSSLG